MESTLNLQMGSYVFGLLYLNFWLLCQLLSLLLDIVLIAEFKDV